MNINHPLLNVSLDVRVADPPRLPPGTAENDKNVKLVMDFFLKALVRFACFRFFAVRDFGVVLSSLMENASVYSGNLYTSVFGIVELCVL